MNPHSVGIHHFGMIADESKVESAFALLDEVLHPAAAVVKPDDLMWFHTHVCKNKSVHVCQLTVWFINFKNHASWIIPGTSLIHEFAISYSITDLVLLGCPVQIFLFIRSKGNK